jgi:hypothetical protein
MSVERVLSRDGLARFLKSILISGGTPGQLHRFPDLQRDADAPGR